MEVDFSKFKIKWPKSFYKGIEIERLLGNTEKSNQRFPPVFPVLVNKNVLKFVFALCEKLKYSIETKIAIINLFSVICSRDPKSVQEDSLLFILASCMMISKIYEKDHVSFETIHNLTNHSYTNPQLLAVEALVVNEFGFDLLNHRNTPLSFNYLYYIYLIKPIFPHDKFPYLVRVCEIIYEVLVIESDKFASSIEEDLFAVALIQCAITILTQHSGFYPFIWKLQNFCYYDEGLILKTAKRMLKLVLGNDFSADLSL